MTLKQNNDDVDFFWEALIAIIEAIDLTYDNSCQETSGLNLSANSGIPISILNLKDQRSLTDLDREGSTFMWKTLLIDCIINMDYKNYDNRDELVGILKTKYSTESALLEDFQMNYKSIEAINWYKKESCLYHELNRALRFNCINMIFNFRFFIRDLSSQLRKEQKKFPNSDGNLVRLYHGQGIYDQEIKRIEALKAGCLISVDSFFSTSRSKDIATGFTKSDKVAGLRPILFEIKCDLALKTKPYADIASTKFGSHPEEQEVLFMVGTLFKFKGILPPDEGSPYWRMKLELFHEDSHRLSKLYQSIRDEMEEETDLLTLGGLLLQAGEHEHVLRIYMRSFYDLVKVYDDLTEYGQLNLAKSLMGIASVQCELGRYDISIEIFDFVLKFINYHKNLKDHESLRASVYYLKSLPLSEKGDYLNALKQCKYALDISIKHLGYINPFVANCYEMMGNIYGNIGRFKKVKQKINEQYQYFEKANHFYNKALNVRRKVHHNTPDHYEISSTYINIGELYRDIGKSDEALEYTLTAYHNFVKAFPKSHNWIGIALDNIGEIYVQQQRYDEAKQKYDEAIDVYKQTLPSDHRFIGETYHNIGKLYCSIYEFDKALYYFKQAKEIYKKKIPDYHYLAIELQGQIKSVTAQLRS